MIPLTRLNRKTVPEISFAQPPKLFTGREQSHSMQRCKGLYSDSSIRAEMEAETQETGYRDFSFLRLLDANRLIKSTVAVIAIKNTPRFNQALDFAIRGGPISFALSEGYGLEDVSPT